jgi:hypothetical protein
MGVSDVPEERIRAWLEASCARQGVPVRVTDAETVRRVAALLGGPVDGPRAHARSASTRPAAGRSQPPPGHDPVDVQTPAARGARGDDGAVEDGGDDGVLAPEVEPGPLGP